MGFRIDKGIFQFKDGDRFINKFKIDTSGTMVEVDPDSGDPVAAYMRTGDQAADSNLLDGVDSSRFVYGGNATKTTNISNVSTALASGFYDGYNITGSPTGTWYTYINMRHNNTGNNYGSQIAVSFYSNADMYVRTISNGTYQGWSKIWNSANFNPTDKASTESVAAVNARIDEEVIPAIDSKLDRGAKAADADKLDGLDSGYYARGLNGYQVMNIDTVKHPGLYTYDGGITGTQPAGTNWYNLKTIEIGYGSRATQIAFPYNNDRVFFRRQQSASWETWKEFITSENIASQSVSYASNSDKLDGYDWMQSGKSVRANEFYADNWFRNYNSGEGLYNQATGQHFYSDDDDYWNVAGGTAANGIRFRDEHAGTIRGYVYANSSNQVGLLDAGGSWAVRHFNDHGTYFYTDNDVEEFKVGRDAVTGDYGTVQISSNRNGWGGYSIYGQYVLMSNGSRIGIYNDIDNEWMIQCYRNAQTELYHNGSRKLYTNAGGINVDGVCTATSFSGSGAGLTDLPVPDQSIPVQINGTGGERILSINMNLDMGQIEFTLTNGQTFTAMMGR